MFTRKQQIFCNKCDGTGYNDGPRLGDESCSQCDGTGGKAVIYIANLSLAEKNKLLIRLLEIGLRSEEIDYSDGDDELNLGPYLYYRGSGDNLLDK